MILQHVDNLNKFKQNQFMKSLNSANNLNSKEQQQTCQLLDKD